MLASVPEVELGADVPTYTALPAELTWGALASTDGATGGWNTTTCTDSYCHGATLQDGGFAPTWTDTDGSEDACRRR